jgi:hypothetical protein
VLHFYIIIILTGVGKSEKNSKLRNCLNKHELLGLIKCRSDVARLQSLRPTTAFKVPTATLTVNVGKASYIVIRQIFCCPLILHIGAEVLRDSNLSRSVLRTVTEQRTGLLALAPGFPLA